MSFPNFMTAFSLRSQDSFHRLKSGETTLLAMADQAWDFDERD
jgi:hypothetical protein